MGLLDPISKERWNATAARHLLNRAGFGVPRERIATLAALSPEEAVAGLVHYGDTPSALPAPDFLLEPMSRREMKLKYEAEGLDNEGIRKRVQEMQGDERRAIETLKGWWLEQMYSTPRPLEEKMTLFWHGHFAVSSQKVKSSWVTYDMNRLLRQFATGNFKALTTAVGQSPAMLDYLDNRKSTKNEPNENWARELMELFTLGQGHYTEDDIKASARAFTGWMCTHKAFVYEPKRHDFGQKTFMGRTGDFDGWQIVDILFEQPALATFITTKLWSFFAYESPEAEIVTALAQLFRDSNYELKPVLEAMFRSEAFYSPRAMGTQIKSPTQFTLQLCADLGLKQIPGHEAALNCRQLGQDLFYPPNVKGWDGNRAWINANALLLRYNAVPALIVAATKKRGAEAQKMTMQEQVDPSIMSDAPSMQAELQPTMQSEEAPAMQSAGQRMATWRKEAMAQAREKIKALPPSERKSKLTAFREAGPGEKMQMLKELGIEPPTGIFTSDPAQVFDEMPFSNGRECVVALEQRLLVAPLSDPQRKTLLESVGVSDPDAALSAAMLDLDQRRALMRLITSVPQYQLC